MVKLNFLQSTSSLMTEKTNLVVLGSSSLASTSCLKAVSFVKWKAPFKILSNDMFKSMLSQHLSLPNRFSPCPTFLISKKLFKWPKISNFMEIKPLWNFLKFWTANLFLYRHIRFLFTISIHQNWMIYRTFYRKLCWFEPLSILPRLTMIVAVLYAVKFRIRLFSHFLFYLNDDLPSF